jgi:uncharacterized protein HemY
MTETTETSVMNVLSNLSNAQLEALAAKFAKQPKNIKKDVRAAGVEGTELEQYATYILRKSANDYINSQMRDIWMQRLEVLIPRLTTKDENLKSATDKQVAQIALEIEDIDQRGEIISKLKASLLPKTSDILGMVACFERLEELFVSAWKA